MRSAAKSSKGHDFETYAYNSKIGYGFDVENAKFDESGEGSDAKGFEKSVDVDKAKVGGTAEEENEEVGVDAEPESAKFDGIMKQDDKEEPKGKEEKENKECDEEKGDKEDYAEQDDKTETKEKEQANDGPNIIKLVKQRTDGMKRKKRQSYGRITPQKRQCTVKLYKGSKKFSGRELLEEEDRLTLQC
ncbi:hypothetical protein Droror1_Dr00021820 [Drosera rotundifolia]